jgi:hypothetical protein
MRRHFDRKDIVFEFQGHDGFKPCAETRGLNIIFNDIQTIIPNNLEWRRRHIQVKGFMFTKMVEKNGKKK